MCIRDSIINMDIPENPTSYLHRAGRTGRGGKSGKVISLSTKGEIRYINRLKRELKLDFKNVYMREGALAVSYTHLV